MARRPRQLPRSQRGGWVLLDVMAAILLLGAIAVLLARVTTSQARAAARLQEDRAALRRAEAALLALGDLSRPAPAIDANVRVRPLPDAAPAGWRWVAIAAPSGSRSVELVGLVPTREEAKR